MADFRIRGGKDAPSNKELNAAILSGNLGFHLAPWDSLSPECRDLVQRLLMRDPACRPSAREALAHPWLAGVRPASSQTSFESHGGAVLSREDSLGQSLVQRLQSFGTSSQLRRVALTILAEVVMGGEQPAHVYSNIPVSLVSDGSVNANPPTVSRSKVMEYLSKESFDLSSDEAGQLLEIFRHNPEARDAINPYEWLAALEVWTLLQERPEWSSWIKKVFDVMDKGGTGSIGLGDLEAAICGNAQQDDELCPFPDAIPSVLREVGHFEDPNKALIGFEEFQAVVSGQAVEPDLFDNRRSGRSQAINKFNLNTESNHF